MISEGRSLLYIIYPLSTLSMIELPQMREVSAMRSIQIFWQFMTEYLCLFFLINFEKEQIKFYKKLPSKGVFYRENSLLSCAWSNLIIGCFHSFSSIHHGSVSLSIHAPFFIVHSSVVFFPHPVGIMIFPEHDYEQSKEDSDDHPWESWILDPSIHTSFLACCCFLWSRSRFLSFCLWSFICWEAWSMSLSFFLGHSEG